ncbi:unnamed protein product, partial [Mesorhabditis belari]|uniref:Uncharacterized protein n=1 Tax=Mesorhabditis belari TaxID=2138241 RepID=A0AAF3J4M7_9BILA
MTVMMEISLEQAKIIGRAFLFFGICDIGESFGLIGDLSLAILAPVIITNGVGFYWVSVFPLPPWLASWLVGIFVGCLDGIIISISASCYYRICLAVPMDKEKLLAMLGMIVYTLNYTTVPLMAYANVDAYAGENYTRSIIESDPDFAYLLSNPYPKMFFDVHRPWVYVLVAVMIPQIGIQILVLGHAFLYNLIYVYRNKDYNISPQTKVLQAQIYIVMAVQLTAVLCCGAVEGVIYAVPQLAHYFIGGLLDPFFNELQWFFDMMQPREDALIE